MSARNSEKLSLTDRFANAAAAFYDKHEDWFYKHPKADAALTIAFTGAVIGYTLLRLPDRALRGLWFWKTTPLEKFEPQYPENHPFRPEAPYWQDLVFGDGRADKLIKRLEGIPQTKPHSQKIALLNSKGGLRILPAHRDLVKYGLNDVQIGRFMYDIDRTVDNLIFHKDAYEQQDGMTIDFHGDVALSASAKGIYTTTASKTPLVEQGGKHQYRQMGLIDAMSAYRGSGHKDENAIAIANHVSAAVYVWIIEDVLPVIPNFFPNSYGSGYVAVPQEDGSFLLNKLPKDYHAKVSAEEIVRNGPPEGHPDYIPADLIHPIKKSLYEILLDGYKGNVPQPPVAPGFTPKPV